MMELAQSGVGRVRLGVSEESDRTGCRVVLAAVCPLQRFGNWTGAPGYVARQCVLVVVQGLMVGTIVWALSRESRRQ